MCRSENDTCMYNMYIYMRISGPAQGCLTHPDKGAQKTFQVLLSVKIITKKSFDFQKNRNSGRFKYRELAHCRCLSQPLRDPPFVIKKKILMILVPQMSGVPGRLSMIGPSLKVLQQFVHLNLPLTGKIKLHIILGNIQN